MRAFRNTCSDFRMEYTAYGINVTWKCSALYNKTLLRRLTHQIPIKKIVLGLAQCSTEGFYDCILSVLLSKSKPL